jgi:type III secretory pathway component EscV
MIMQSRTLEFVSRNTHQFRQFLFPDIAIHLPPIKIRLSAEDKKKLMEEVTLAEGSNATSDTLTSKK